MFPVQKQIIIKTFLINKENMSNIELTHVFSLQVKIGIKSNDGTGRGEHYFGIYSRYRYESLLKYKSICDLMKVFL